MAKIRIGMIGCGGFTRYRLNNTLKVAEAEVVALSDPEASQIAETKEKHPGTAEAKEFSDYREMIAEGNLDAVMIATPHTQHVDQILDSLNAGLHTLCEKPLITSVADAHRVIEARDRAGKVGMVSYQRRFQPEFRYIRERLLSGEAGKLQFVIGLSCQEWKKATAGTWRQIPELSGGGQLNDTGSHFVDILLHLVGKKVKSVSAYGDNREVPVDIDSALSIQFADGVLGSITIVGDAPAWHEEITLFTDTTAFYIRNGELQTQTFRGKKETIELPKDEAVSPDQHFVDCITKGIPCESPFEAGLEVIGLTEAAWQSMAGDGAAIKVA